VTPGNTYEVNLTSLVSSDGTYSLKAMSTSSNGADYTSREGAAGFGPLLVVTLQP
jgi:acid phosphatase type 7